MKLSYRGVSYQNQPSVPESQPLEIGGRYRGQAAKYPYPRHVPQPFPSLEKKYRGVAYGTPSSSQREGCAPPIGQSCRVSLGRLSRGASQQAEQIHFDNIRQNLERRLQIAKAKGDENLVQLLEKECREIALHQ